MVEDFLLATPGPHEDLSGGAAHGLNRRPRPKRRAGLPQGGFEPFDILDRASVDRVPLILPGGIEQRVVLEEADHRIGGEIHDLLGGRGPDRPGERQQVVVAEPVPGAEQRKEVPKGQTFVPRHLDRFPVETEDVADHAEKGG
jgi:hypothetical protein